jgi:ribosomal-protein-alanine N-acetyltransferase
MICVRRAQSEDVPRLMEIARHSATAAQWNEEDYAKIFAPDSVRGHLALAVLENDKVMGFLLARSVAQDDYEWEIENVVVLGTARRRGLGTRLLREFLELAGARGAREVFLEVRESNEAARNLYEKRAFVEVGRRTDYYRNPAEDALIFRFTFPQ